MEMVENDRTDISLKVEDQKFVDDWIEEMELEYIKTGISLVQNAFNAYLMLAFSNTT